MNKHHHAIIMAGGIGSRFWPLSRNQKPKQFIDILGTGKSLIQMTFDRLCLCVPQQNIWVVTNLDYFELVKDQLPLIESDRILCEPSRKNTAPCIAFAAAVLKDLDPESSMLIAPSDHLILNDLQFVKDIHEGFQFVESTQGLLTLGIQASRPDTGYGYIHFNNYENQSHDIFPVVAFVEKPNHNLALQYLESGNYLWNSGMFIWKTSSIISAMEEYTPAISDLFSDFTMDQLELIYDQVESISIDFAVMEKSKNVYVKTVDFGWSDLGTWGSLYHLSKQDDRQNVIHSDKQLLYDVNQCIIHSNTDQLIVVQGLNDYIIINTADVLLICEKSNEQNIKQMVADAATHFGKNNFS